MATQMQDLVGEHSPWKMVVFLLCGFFLWIPLTHAVNSHINAQEGSLLYEIVLLASLWVVTLPMVLVGGKRIWLFLMIVFSIYHPFNWLLQQLMPLWLGNAFFQWKILEPLCRALGLVAGGLVSYSVFKKVVGPRTVSSKT